MTPRCSWSDTLEGTPQRGAAGRTVADALTAWLEHNEGSYSPSTLRDQTSRARQVAEDKVSSIALARLSVSDVERWPTRLRRSGVGDSAIRIA